MFFQILILAIIQGAAELLPVSSSAHVIVAEKLMGLDPTTPEMTFFLVMLHTGTMFAVILFFWKRWIAIFQKGTRQRKNFVTGLIVATGFTGIIGFFLKAAIEKILKHGGSAVPDIESLFGNLLLISVALFAAGVLILISGYLSKRKSLDGVLTLSAASKIGVVQGLCLPFRGFSRSGATISTALLLKIEHREAEDFSFALAVILTPAVIAREAWRLLKPTATVSAHESLTALLMPGFFGLIVSFVAGLLALKLLSSLIDRGLWQYFGYYCFLVSAAALLIYIH